MSNSYRFTAALVSQELQKTTTNPSCTVPPSSCSVKPFPIRVISTPLVSHMFTFTGTLTFRRINHTLAKPLRALNHGTNPRHSMVYIASVLFNGGDSETNE